MVLERATAFRRTSLSPGVFFRSFDWLLFLTALVLTGYGMAMIYSATHGDSSAGDALVYVRNQLVGLGLGLVAGIGLSLLDFERLLGWQKYIYGFMVLLLVVTLFIGSGRNDAHRWIALPFFDLQSAELAKLLLIVTLSAFLAEGLELRGRFRYVLLAVGYVAVPTLLVYLEPDLGTSLVLVAILVATLLAWGIRWGHLAALAGAGVAMMVLVLRGLPALGINLLKEYQVQRLLVFLNPERDLTGEGYQLMQSRIAVASGMYTGKGYMQGTQTHLNFLPEHHTDFIFAVIGEELGFVGAILLLALYLLLIWRVLRIAGRSKSMYGTLIGAGVAGAIVFQVFVNVGMTIGIMPVTGIPLPLLSYGSASLVVFWMAIGLLESIQVRSLAAQFNKRIPPGV
ncbi:MAG: rod shape-determining protein RodA [Gaiellales bacterium]|nr:rod shape-determining protein RodA [Gaiellales bacterium]